MPREVKFAVLLRLVQWLLNDLTPDLPHGRVSVEKRTELANSLELLATFIRATPSADTIEGDHAQDPEEGDHAG